MLELWPRYAAMGCGRLVGPRPMRVLMARGGHGFGEVEPLAGVGAELGQGLAVFGGLDTFGDHGHSQAMGELND
ncbi:MAG TPA: hypothetical protein VIK04_13555 [Solirubrobacteraceae bacterium]